MLVGVTFFLHKSPAKSIWSSGGMQHSLFLYKQLQLCEGVEVVAINGGDGDAPSAAMMYGGVKFVRMHEVVDKLDVLIQAGAQVYADDVAKVRSRGGKAVAYKFGNDYVINTECVIHGKPSGSIFNGAQFDEVWTNEQHVNTCSSYWEICYRAPVRVLPHIWEPWFIDKAVAELARAKAPPWGYNHTGGAVRVGIFEPNLNIVKTCHIPMLVCEQTHRQRPGLISEVIVTHTLKLKNHLTFRKFVNNLDIQKDGLCFFEGRFNTPMMLSRHVDVVVTAQIENGLNYIYYDALYGGYPLVHNSSLLPAGYRYDGFDVKGGAEQLIKAIVSHDSESYNAQAETLLESVSIRHNTKIHEQALKRLINGTDCASRKLAS